MAKQGYVVKDDVDVYFASSNITKIFNAYCRLIREDYDEVKYILNENKEEWKADFETHMNDGYICWSPDFDDDYAKEEFEKSGADDLIIQCVEMV